MKKYILLLSFVIFVINVKCIKQKTVVDDKIVSIIRMYITEITDENDHNIIVVSEIVDSSYLLYIIKEDSSIISLERKRLDAKLIYGKSVYFCGSDIVGLLEFNFSPEYSLRLPDVFNSEMEFWQIGFYEDLSFDGRSSFIFNQNNSEVNYYEKINLIFSPTKEYVVPMPDEFPSLLCNSFDSVLIGINKLIDEMHSERYKKVNTDIIFNVDEKGIPNSYRLSKSTGSLLSDQDLIRLFEKNALLRFKPAIYKGDSVIFADFTLPLRFHD